MPVKYKDDDRRRGDKKKSRNNRKPRKKMTEEDDDSNDACSTETGRSNSSIFGPRSEADKKTSESGKVGENRKKKTDKKKMDKEAKDEISSEEEIETRFEELIDDLSQKNSKIRQKAFLVLNQLFGSKYIPDYAEDQKITITDAIEKTLKKGSPSEQYQAVQLSTLLYIQLGMFKDADDIYRSLRKLLISILNDKSNIIQNGTYETKSECCWALSLCELLSENDDTDIAEIQQLLFKIFSSSISEPQANSKAVHHAEALSTWTLLLTCMTPTAVYNTINSSDSSNDSKLVLNLIKKLLQSPCLELRLAAGEALAVIFELGREVDEDYEEDYLLELIDELKAMAADSTKSRAKKDRKQQRTSFREILRFLEEDVLPKTSIKVGPNRVGEELVLNSWRSHVQYEAFCRILGVGIDIHLINNGLLRDVFGLGEPIDLDSIQLPENSKKLQHNAYLQADKARTVLMNKVRDKRSAALY